jgi:hypothetical protein
MELHPEIQLQDETYCYYQSAQKLIVTISQPKN